MRHQSVGTRGGVVDPRLRVTALLFSCAYLLFVAWLTLRPVPALWVAPPNIRPFATIKAELDQGAGHAVPTLGAMLGLLAPLGVSLPLLGRRLGGTRFPSLIRTVFAVAMVALGFELAQSYVPSQVADVDALLLNTLGAGLVHVLFFGRLRAVALRIPRPPGPPAGSSQGRLDGPGPSQPKASSPGLALRSPRVGIAPRSEALNQSLPVR